LGGQRLISDEGGHGEYVVGASIAVYCGMSLQSRKRKGKKRDSERGAQTKSDSHINHGKGSSNLLQTIMPLSAKRRNLGGGLVINSLEAKITIG